MNKTDLLNWLQQQHQQYRTLLDSIDPQRMEQPGVNGDWSIKDLIAHLNGWNQWLVARLQAAQRGDPEPPPPWPAHLQTEDEINAWIYDTNRTRPLRDILHETDQQIQQILATIHALPDDVRVERIDPDFHLLWIDDTRYLPGELFDHFRDDHQPDLLTWLTQTEQK